MRFERAVSLVLLAVGCSSPTSQPPELPRLTFPAMVGAEGAIVSGVAGSELEGVELTVPRGALENTITIDARIIADEPVLSAVGSAVGPTVLITPEGQALAQPATLSLPIFPSKVADLEQTPADCRGWLRLGDAWSQVPRTGGDDAHVAVAMSTLGAGAAGAVLKAPSTSVAAGPPCVDPSGFCVTPLAEGLAQTSSRYSAISSGGKLYAWKARTTATGIAGVVTEYDVAKGAGTRASIELELPSGTLAGPVLSDAAQRVALAGDDTVWVPLPGGVAHLSFTAKGSFFAETTKDTRTAAVVFTGDGVRHRVRLTGNKAGTVPTALSVSSTSGATEPPPTEFDAVNGPWQSDHLPVFGLKSTLAYAFPAGKNRLGQLAPPKTVADLPVPSALTAAEREVNPPDELTFSANGELMAVSLTRSDTAGRSLWIQSRDGSISRGIAGLGNLNALEFTGDGILWAASAGAALVFRIDPVKGSVVKVPLTDAAFGTAEYKAKLPVALRSFSFSSTRHALFVITGDLVRGVVRVEPSTGTQMTTDGGSDAGLDAGTDAGVDAGTDAGFDAGFDAGVDAGPAPCTSSSCLNGGTCPATGVCLCPAFTTGEHCEVDLNECAAFPSPCGTGSACADLDGGFACSCVSGLTSATSDGRNCATAGRAIELAIFYDESIQRLWGDQAEANIDELFRQTAATFDGTGFTPPLKLTLEALAPLSPAPAAITYRACNTPDPARPACTGCWSGVPPQDCSNPLSTRPDEVDQAKLLETFLTYVQAKRAAPVRFDDAILLTTRDFAATGLELSFVASTCSQLGGGVLQVRPTSSPQFNAMLLAHALGHNLSMPHDSVTGFIMSPTFGSSPATSFSSGSIAAANNFMSTPGAGCLLDGGTHAWATTRCGDGRVDPGEQCDPGVASDSCCTSSCQLAAGCACANSQPCCLNGAVVDAGVACRASDGTCDQVDRCDGVSTACPDRLTAPGVSCGDGGTCLRGGCFSRDALCVGLGTVGQCRAPLSTACNTLSCDLGGSCGAFAIAPDGVGCGASSQCSAGTCQASSALVTWRWSVGAFGPCTSNVKRRAVTCVAETGASGPDGLCPPPRPVSALNCP